MTGEEAAEGSEVPTLFVAVTVNVYAVPLVNPIIAIGDDAEDAVSPPGEAVTV